MNIGIIGVGMVGGTLANYYKDAKKWDPYKGFCHDLSGCDIIFICVPTPYNENGYDLSIVHEALRGIRGGQIAVLRSTVLPGTSKMLSEEYDCKIVFNPEFLSESTAQENFEHPELQVVGGNEEDCKKVLEILPKAKKTIITDWDTAETIKMSRNLLSAAKVVVMNEIYDSVDADYSVVEEGLQALEERGSHHFKVVHKGGRGAGGKCLPKELNAFVNRYPTKALKSIRDVNEWLLMVYPKHD